uniref:Uncharacterized protein n=1 Tax=Oryza sativa subsp. japonica TaxID=39947 RepID=Q6H5I0_ORYSJ|nr:hypothetical protein [Oryza sativa Japonica Group]
MLAIFGLVVSCRDARHHRVVAPCTARRAARRPVRGVGVVAGGGTDAIAHMLTAVLAAMHKLEENHPEAVNISAVLATAAPVAAANARCVGVGERVCRGLHRASANATRARAAAPQAACRLSAPSLPLCAARRRSPFSEGRKRGIERRGRREDRERG